MNPPSAFLRRGLPLLACALAFATFARTIGFGYLADWDDGANIIDNEAFRGFGREQFAWMLTARHMGHWHPLTWLSLALDDAIAPGAQWIHHLTNVTLHALNALLCQRVLLAVLRLAGQPESARLHVAASIGALLFAVHPLRVESIAWVTERRDVLSGFFFLATVQCWLHRREGARWYWLALLAYAGTLLSKAWGITMPVLLLLLDHWPLQRWRLEGRRPRGDRQVLLDQIPFVLLAAGTAWLAAIAQAESGARLHYEYYGFGMRLLQACYGLWFYPLATLWPVGLSPLYELWHGLDFSAPEFLFAALGTALAALAVLVMFRTHPGISTALALYAVAVSPVLGFNQSGPQLVADRYSYLACIPFAGLAAAFLHARPRWLTWSPLLVALLAALSVVQSGHWRDSYRLWQRTLQVEPDNGTAAFNLARLLVNDGVALAESDKPAADRLWQQAQRLLDVAMRHWPHDPDTMASYGIVLLNLYGPQQGYELGIPFWLRALELDPGHADARGALEAARRARPDLFK